MSGSMSITNGTSKRDTKGRIVKVAAVQAASVSFDLPASLAKVDQLVKEAKHNGAGLVVLPEAFLSAYPRRWGFAIGARTEEQREWYGRYVESSLMIPPNPIGRDPDQLDLGEEYEGYRRLCGIVKAHGVYLSIGIVERSSLGATLWCCNLLFSPSGTLLSRHRKFQPTAAERVVWSQGEAVNRDPLSSLPASKSPSASQSGPVQQVEESNLVVVPTPMGRLGGLICWENYMPLARYLLYKQGVEIYLAPTADARPTWLPSMQHIAQEGRCYVISANQYQTPSDFPDDYPANLEACTAGKGEKGKEGEEVWSAGGSCIVGPLGDVLAGPLWGEEGILYADLDLNRLSRVKLDFDAAGHYAREDLLFDMLTRSR